MKFRHPTGVRLASTAGHVTTIGPEWRELRADMHREALAHGCECDQNTIRTRPAEPAKASEQAVVPLDETAAIRAALIAMVERNGEDDFTDAGNPNLKTLSRQAGFKVEKQAALAVWHQLEAEAAQANDSGDGAGE